jgi:hypothetical protein
MREPGFVVLDMEYTYERNALNVSVTTVTRQFATLEGVLDLGSPTSCHKRRKRILRIPRSTLERYIAERKVLGRRRKGQ